MSLALQDREYQAIPDLDSGLTKELQAVQTKAQMPVGDYQSQILNASRKMNEAPADTSQIYMRGDALGNALENRINRISGQKLADMERQGELQAYKDRGTRLGQVSDATQNQFNAAQDRYLMAQDFKLKRQQYQIDLQNIKRQQDMQRKSIIGSIAGLAGTGIGLAAGGAPGALIGGAVGGLAGSVAG